MSEDIEFISSEFDIFVKKPIQSAILDNHVVRYKTIATVDQNDLEFLVPGDNETYTDLNIKLFVKSRLLGPDGKTLDASDHTAGTNNLLHFLFSQCSIALNGVHVYKRFLCDRVRSYARSGSVGRSRVTPTSGDIRIDLKFAKALPESITCLLYLEYDNSVHIDLARIVSTDFS